MAGQQQQKEKAGFKAIILFKDQTLSASDLTEKYAKQNMMTSVLLSSYMKLFLIQPHSSY